ncbi:MAG: hypothetical protein OEY50_00340 [Nitrospinota bacterium]|nr:hypothetical protein [Nitrospinota bacterium]
MSEAEFDSPTWWGEYSFEVDQIHSWKIGPIKLYIQMRANEWLFAFRREDVSADVKLGWNRTMNVDSIPRDCELERYAFKEAPRRIKLTPMLASKQVITRPTTPFHLMPGEQVTVYAGTPVWVKIETLEPKTKLTSISTRRLSDTWFGKSTTEGELCYSTKTKCRIRVEEAPISANRAVTPVRITNLSSDKLELKEISLPMPYLTLFKSSDGHLWTSPVSIIRDKVGNKITVGISKTPPKEVEHAELIAEAQKKEKSHVMKDVISAVFGETF